MLRIKGARRCDQTDRTSEGRTPRRMRHGLMDPPARKGTTVRELAVTMIALAAALIVDGCSTAESPPPAAAPAPDAVAPQVSFVEIPGQYPQPASMTDSGAADAPVGGCVNVSGSPPRAVLDAADCTSPVATYRVIQRVITPGQCVADADRPFYYRDAHAHWTACLDVNWDNTYCINLDAVLTKVACDDPAAPRKLKPTSVLAGTTTVDNCPQNGFPHRVRRFIVCAEPQP